MKKQLLKEGLFFSMTWDYLNVFLPSQNQDSPKTVKAYTDGLTVFRRYLTAECRIPIEQFRYRDLTYDFILDYRTFLLRTGYKPNTVNHRLAVITAYLRYAASRKPDLIQIYMNISEVPYVTVPSQIRDIIEDQDAIAMLLSAPRPSKIGVRDQVILVVLYDTAIRADELIGLDLKDVNISVSEPYLRVNGKGNKERIVSLTEKTIPLIKQYISLYHSDRSYKKVPFIYTIIKGKTDRMSERNVERIVKKYGDMIRKEKPDIPPQIYPHMLRRTRASGWYRDGVPIEVIAVILGHADAKTTRKSYARPSAEMLRKEMAKGNPPDPKATEIEEQPLWSNDDELARLCGIR